MPGGKFSSLSSSSSSSNIISVIELALVVGDDLSGDLRGEYWRGGLSLSWRGGLWDGSSGVMDVRGEGEESTGRGECIGDEGLLDGWLEDVSLVELELGSDLKRSLAEIKGGNLGFSWTGSFGLGTLTLEIGGTLGGV